MKQSGKFKGYAIKLIIITDCPMVPSMILKYCYDMVLLPYGKL